MRIQRSSILVFVIVASACAAPVGVGQTPADRATATSAASVAPTSVPSPSPSASAAAAGPLEGTWSTGPVTCEQQNAALTKAGFTDDQLTLGGWDRETCMDIGRPLPQAPTRTSSRARAR